MSPANQLSLISVVIPTRNRPQMVKRAIRSALGQTLPPHEIIVVVDGPDPATAAAVADIQDSRVRLLALDISVGGAEARNRGVQAATGELIAFLDDDDEWLPQKLELQARLYLNAGDPHTIIACRVAAKSPYGEFIWPRRLYSEPEDIGDYLFTRRSPFQGEALVQTSMILTSKALMEAAPFRIGLKCHQEWDWLLRSKHEAKAKLLFCEDVLAIWYIEQDRESISSATTWQDSMSWIDSMAGTISRQAYAGFLLTILAPRAIRAGGLAAFGDVLKRACLRGRPSWRMLSIAFGMLVLSQHHRRWLRARLQDLKGIK